MTEEIMLETLKNWNFLKNRIQTLNKKLNEKSFKVTASMSGDVRVPTGYNETSKIEAFCFSRLKLIDERDEIMRKMNLCTAAYNKTALIPIERVVIGVTMREESLLELAKKLNMPQAKIYRIRNRAIKKMLETLQNEALN